ncbi:acetyl-CoA carboxylase biotin carboxyl carrier protein subunit [Tenacibaculum sp. IB213877]|uniref:acetyl-CoA carboxylase biotin carboxyl carrier protein subunit n=1 Tax=Tenacibaculum sp. IB213877 TaxID=3097351 RepID=UPI002A5AF4D5|nr:acetyl-CoA carboxylase biotin carboxyl carrier protein subunit [Tenacibaculum sp. IB213877]MDY0780837.1 acetyl-CoA carboxylase biotin carboxyl carrier protein subunit [Tenacibaculum sp. IB213877]
MKKSFKTKVNNLYDFDFDIAEIESLNYVKNSSENFHILENNQSYKAEILQADFNKKAYTVQVNGNSYTIKIANELDMLISELGLEATSAKKENDIKAPMPGLIVSVDVEVGQEVAEGDGILVLEAMKMENTLTAPRAGVIKSIAVQSGDKVEKNTVLIEME